MKRGTVSPPDEPPSSRTRRRDHDRAWRSALRGDILYAFALSKSGSVIHIDDHTRGDRVTCIGCGERMVGRLGEVRARHFAHVVAMPGCDGESWLHRTAKLLVQAGFDAARAASRPYELRWRCGGCGCERSVDTVSLDVEIKSEFEAAPGTRSDLVFVGRRRSFVVEIVVTHPLEPSTRAAYAEARLAVFTIEPTSDGLPELLTAIRASDTMNVGTDQCAECRRRAAIAARIRGVVEALRSCPPTTQAMVGWSVDKRGNELRDYLRRRLARTGTALLKAGFRQARMKPWLFFIVLPDNIGTFFADMGGSEEVPIWKDTRPLVYIRPKQCSEPERIQLLPALIAYGRGIGVEMRVSFYERAGVDES